MQCCITNTYIKLIVGKYSQDVSLYNKILDVVLSRVNKCQLANFKLNV